MNRIGRSIFRTLLILIPLSVLSGGGIAVAQSYSVEATLSENRVFVGEQFALQIDIRGQTMGNIELPEIPDIDGVRVLNTIPSRSQSISIINGQTTTVTSYIFTLIAREEGTYTIPPVQVQVDGESRTTQPLQVEVLTQRSLQSETGERRPDIFIQMELDEEEPFVGQQIMASLVIYFRAGMEVTSYQPASGWRTDGFWKEQMESVDHPQAETVIFGDVRYRRAILLRYALFPSRSGDLTLSPYEINVGVRTRPRRNDPFGSVFGGLGTNQRTITLESEEIPISVRRLSPPEDAEYIGAVGRFTIERRASVTRARVGEPLEIITTVSGTGNIPLINRPSYEFPDHVEIYSPREETDLSRRGTTIQGTRTFTDRIVPRTTGSFTLPEKQIAYYNPDSGQFVRQVLPEIRFEIIHDQAALLTESDGEIQLQLLTGGAIWHSASERDLLAMPWVWAGFLIPVVSLIIAWRQKRLNDRLQTDNEFARSHHAWDRVEELLLKAEKSVGSAEPGEVYHLLHRSITGYIADRTGLPVAGYSDEEISQTVADRTNDPELLRELRKMLQKCSSISYAPPGSVGDIESDISRTREVLKQLRKSL